MAIDFPGSPSTGERHSHNNTTWEWDGSSWNRITIDLSTTDAATLSGIAATQFARRDDDNIITGVTTFIGNGYTGVGNTVLIVEGDARVTGVLSVGQGSVSINERDIYAVGVVTGANFKTGTTNVHNVGVEAAGINVLGADTPIGTGATVYNSGLIVSKNGLEVQGVSTFNNAHTIKADHISTGVGATVGIGSTAYVHKLALQSTGSPIQMHSYGGGTLLLDRPDGTALGAWSTSGLKICGGGVAHDNAGPDINTQLHIKQAGNVTVKLESGAMNGVGLQFLNSGASGSADHSILSTYDFNFLQAFSSTNLGTNRRIFQIKEYSSHGPHNSPVEMYVPVIFRDAWDGSVTARIDHLTGIGTFKKIVTEGDVFHCKSGGTFNEINVTGVSTFVGDAVFSGNVSIGKTLTYEDVKNIDSVGVITARAGFELTSGTFKANSQVGTAGSVLSTTGSGIHWVSPQTGPQGAQGHQGHQGVQGAQGHQGRQGAAGVAGAQGAQGRQGAAGSSGGTGAQGVQGAQGHQGVQGAQGAQGATGAQGHQGHQGVQGAQGHQGVQGSVGIASLTISTSAPSGPAQGDMWWDSDDSDLHLYYNDGNSSQWVNINSGTAGVQGAVGATGAQGHQGVQGAQGHQGVVGAQGATGAQGHQGVQGAAGTNATISNNSDNRVITGGSGTNLNGEASLHFNGTSLSVGGSNVTDVNLLTLNGSGASTNIGIVFNKTNSPAKAHSIQVHNGTGDLLFYDYTASAERLRITSAGNVGVNCTPTANDLASGSSFAIPKMMIQGPTSDASHHVLRLHAGTDSDWNAAILTLNHGNDRGIAIYGGRSSGNKSWGAIKSIDNIGRVSNAFEILGHNGQGVEFIKFYTGNSTSTTERLRIDSAGVLYTGNYSTTLDATPGSVQINGGTSGGRLGFRGSTTSAGGGLGEIHGYWDTNKVASILFHAGSDTSNKDDGEIRMYTRISGGSADERLRIASDGKLYVGATGAVGAESWLFRNDAAGGADGCRLTIYNASNNSVNNQARLSLRTAHSETTFSSYNQGEIYISNSHASAYFVTYLGGTERMRITSAGNIGINHTSPDTRLSVMHQGGGSSTYDVLTVGSTGYGNATYPRIKFATTGNNNVIGRLGIFDAGATQPYSGDFVVELNTGSQSWSNTTEKMRVKANGDVLWNNVSTGTPGLGNGTAGLAFEPRNGSIFCSRADSESVYVNRNGNGGLIRLLHSGTHKASIGIESTNDFNIWVNGTSRLRVTQAGHTQILGTTAQTGTGGNSIGLDLHTGGGTSVPVYFGSEQHSAQKSIYLSGYWMYYRGHVNEGHKMIFSQSAGNAPHGNHFEFKYNSAKRPGGGTTWNSGSDQRAKENIQTITNGIATIKQLRPVTFNWTDDYADAMGMYAMDKSDPEEYNWVAKKENGYDTDAKNGRYGFIAQEFETVFPKDITKEKMKIGDTDINDFRTLNHDSLIPALTAALKEAIAKIETLETKVAALESS